MNKPDQPPANPREFSFEAMRGPAHMDWDTTVAYWPVHIVDVSAFESIMSAQRLQSELCLQCDAEDQASVGDDDMIGNPEINPSVVRPFCPVQLALRWTPFAIACDIFGEPSACELSKTPMQSAFAAWLKPAPNPRMPRLPIFGARFEKRFLRVAEHLSHGGLPFAISAVIGYSYEPDSKSLSRVTRAAMKAHGFAFASR